MSKQINRMGYTKPVCCIVCYKFMQSQELILHQKEVHKMQQIGNDIKVSYSMLIFSMNNTLTIFSGHYLTLISAYFRLSIFLIYKINLNNKPPLSKHIRVFKPIKKCFKYRFSKIFQTIRFI